VDNEVILLHVGSAGSAEMGRSRLLIFLLPAFDAASGERGMMMLLPCPTPPAGFTERKIAMPNERIPLRGNPRNFDVVLDVPSSQSCLASHESTAHTRPGETFGYHLLQSVIHNHPGQSWIVQSTCIPSFNHHSFIIDQPFKVQSSQYQGN
jgi:hypothetical protein